MTQAQFIADATSDVVMIAFAASVLFVAVYTVLARWWATEFGRAIVTLDTGLALVLGPSVLHRLLDVTVTSSIWFAWYFLLSLALVAGPTLWRTWIMAKAQWRERRKPAPRRDTETAG